jgi:hypothetical protein
MVLARKHGRPAEAAATPCPLVRYDDAQAVDFAGRVNALVVVHSRPTPKASNSPVHHEAIAVRASGRKSRLVFRTVGTIAFNLEKPSKRRVECTGGVMNDSVFHRLLPT